MSNDSLYIFVTGVVGRAMGSGKFDASHIGLLTQSALDAFQEHLAPKLAQSAPAPRPAPSASQTPPRASGGGGGKNDVEPESKSFSVWGGDKSYCYGRNDALWADLLAEAQEGNQATIKLLESESRKSIGDDPQWQRNNARRIARAKACLLMLSQP